MAQQQRKLALIMAVFSGGLNAAGITHTPVVLLVCVCRWSWYE